MPGVTIVIDPSVAVDVDTATEDFLEDKISSLVADYFHLKDGVAGVGVEWAHPTRTKNASPIGIKVEYSESEDLHPDLGTRKALVKSLTNLVREYPHRLPSSVIEISAWVLPHPGAVFDITSRPT